MTTGLSGGNAERPSTKNTVIVSRWISTANPKIPRTPQNSGTEPHPGTDAMLSLRDNVRPFGVGNSLIVGSSPRLPLSFRLRGLPPSEDCSFEDAERCIFANANAYAYITLSAMAQRSGLRTVQFHLHLSHNELCKYNTTTIVANIYCLCRTTYGRILHNVRISRGQFSHIFGQSHCIHLGPWGHVYNKLAQQQRMPAICDGNFESLFLCKPAVVSATRET